MSKILFLFTLFCVTLSFDPLRLLPLFRRLDAECSNHGFLYKSVCYCTPDYSGPRCESRTGSKIRDDPRDNCDNVFNKLDLLANISPENYPGDDFLFSRFNESTIGAGDNAAYAKKPKTWIKMHDVNKNFQIFIPGPLRPTSVIQLGLGDCYLLAGLAALANSANGDFVREAFNTPQDNANHVYVTRWLINGKPRFVAVDDWVPGDARGMAFAQGSSDGEFWGPILEKAWAKIHGSYMAAESGWHTEFWHGITQAPIYTVHHSEYTAATLFDLVAAKTSKGYPFGAGTSPNTNLAQNHAYAVLKTFDLKLSNGRNVKLVKCYNPWRKDDDWSGNPWGDSSSAWTAELRQLTGQTNNAEDGVFFLSPEDYYTNFDSSDWVTARRDYDVSFVDVPIDSKKINVAATYTATFTVNNPSGDAIYVYIDKPDTRLFKTVVEKVCPKLFKINSYRATSGTETFNAVQDGEYVVKVYKSGSYKFEFSITNLVTYSDMITITAYGPKGSVVFDKQNIQPGLNCANLRNCNFNGICNTYDGTCQCYLGWGGADCSQKKVLSCPNNCNGKGTCDSNTGVCSCDPGFAPPGCTPCPADKDPNCADMGRQACLPTDINYKYAQQSCSKYCGDLGYPGFGLCSKLCRANSDCKNGGTCDTTTGTCKCPGGFLYPNCDPCEDRASDCSGLQNSDCVPGGLNYGYAQQSCQKFCGSKGYPGFGDCSVLCKANSDCPNGGTCNTATGACQCAPGYLAPKCSPCTDLKDCSRLDASYCSPTSQNFNYMKAYCQKFCGSKGMRTGFEECYIPR